jgi:hypothetical protein
MHLKVNKEKRTRHLQARRREIQVCRLRALDLSARFHYIRESQKQESKSRKISESKWQIWQLFASASERTSGERAASAAAHSR